MLTYTVQWDKGGTPDGFFVFRFDLVDSAWHLITLNGGLADTIAGFKSSLQAAPHELNVIYDGNPKPAAFVQQTGVQSYSLIDNYGPDRVAVSYQIIQYWLDGSCTPLVETAPTFTRPADNNGNTVGDNLIFVNTPYARGLQLTRLNLHDVGTAKDPPVGDPLGVIRVIDQAEITAKFPGLYGLHEFNKQKMLELWANTRVRFEHRLRFREIRQGVLIWS